MLPDRYFLILVCLALIISVIASGCTSSGDASENNDTASDKGAFHFSFAELAGTYVSVDDPASSIILDETGAARVVNGESQSDTSYYMETGELYLADGTGIGPYPVQDGTLVFRGTQYKIS